MRKGTITRAVVLLAAASLAVASAACGDSEGVSKTDYLASARAVCQTGRQSLAEASAAAFAKVPPGQTMSAPEIDSFVRQSVIPTLRDQVRQLRALPPPKGKKGKVEEIYRALEKGLDELEKAPKRLIDGTNPFRDAERLATKYGIGVCATTG